MTSGDLWHAERSLHPVLQLADVAGPGVKMEGAQRIGREFQREEQYH